MKANSSLGLALGTMGAVTTAIGTYDQAVRQQDTLNYEAAVASNNQKIAEYQARQAQVIGAQMMMASRIKTAQTTGSARAALGANNVDLGYGSATNVLATTAYMGERDALTIQDNANRQQWAYQMQAQNYGAESAADKAMGAGISPAFSGATSLIGGASGVADSYTKYAATVNGG